MTLNTTLVNMEVTSKLPRRVSSSPRKKVLPQLLPLKLSPHLHPLPALVLPRRKLRRLRKPKKLLPPPRTHLLLLTKRKPPSSSTLLELSPTVTSSIKDLISLAEMVKVLTVLALPFAPSLRKPLMLSLGLELVPHLITNLNTTLVMKVMSPPILMALSPLLDSSLRLKLEPSLKVNPRKCKFLNPKFTKSELTLIDLKPEPPSTTSVMVSGDKLSFKVKRNLLPPNPLLRLKKERLPLRRHLLYPRLLLSSTPSGPTPSNKLDGLNKELPTLRTSLIKLLFTNPGKQAMPDPSNGENSSTKVD
jgi:hypothetical protein